MAVKWRELMMKCIRIPGFLAEAALTDFLDQHVRGTAPGLVRVTAIGQEPVAHGTVRFKIKHRKTHRANQRAHLLHLPEQKIARAGSPRLLHHLRQSRNSAGAVVLAAIERKRLNAGGRVAKTLKQGMVYRFKPGCMLSRLVAQLAGGIHETEG